MATKLDAGDVGKGELFLIDPDEISVDESLNGRWKPHSEEEIDSLAQSIVTDGQLQPVTIRKLADNHVQLVLGYRRYLALKKINEARKKGDRLKLKCVLAAVNNEEAFRKNIVENKNRKSTSPVDDAHNQRRLREEFGWADTKIAEFYNCSPSMVTLLKKILLLPDDIKARVHKRELALNAAASLVELNPEEQREVLKPEPEEGNTLPAEGENGTPEPTPGGGAATATQKKTKTRKGKGNKGGTPSTRTIVNRVRTIKGGKAGKNGKPRTQSRSLAEVRTFFEGLTGPGERKAVRETAEFIVKYASGTYATDDAAEKRFKEILS